MKFFKRPVYQTHAGISIVGNNIYYTVAKSTDEIVAVGCLKGSSLHEALAEVKKCIGDSLCSIALPQRIAIIRTLHFDESYKEHALDKIIKTNAQSYFSSSVQSINYDFESLADGKQVRLLGCRKEDLTTWLNAFAKVKLKIKLVTIDVLALENVLVKLGLVNSDKVYAVFFIQDAVMLQVVLVSSVIYLSNSAVLSEGSSFYEEIQKFICLYETNCNHPVLNEIMILCEDNDSSQMIHLNCKAKITYYSNLEKLTTKPLPLIGLLPWGAFASC